MTHFTFTLGRALVVSNDLPRACVVAAGFTDLTMVGPEGAGEGLPGEEPYGCAVLMAGVEVGEVLPDVRARCTGSAIFLVETVHQDPSAGTDLRVVDQVELGGVEFAVLTTDRGPRGPLSGPDLRNPEKTESKPAGGPSPTESPADPPIEPDLPDRVPKRSRPARSAAVRNEKRSPARPRSFPVLAGAALVLAVAAAALAAWLTGTGYVGGVLTLLMLGGAAGLGLFRRQQRRAVRGVARSERALTASIAEQQRAGQARVEKRVEAGMSQMRTANMNLTSRIDDQSTQLAELVRQLSVLTAVSLDTSRRIGPPPASEPYTAPATLTEQHQVQALLNLFGLVPVRAVIPAMGGWAASPDVIAVLVDDLLSQRPGLIVECGSGVSTLWLALVIAQFDLPTRIISLDHDPHYAEQTRQTLRQHGVAEAAEVRVAPLVPSTLPGHDTPWYDPAATEDLRDIGLLFVDGPPDTTGPLVRLPAVPMMRDHFARQCTIVLDDVVRASEQEVVARWQILLPDFTVERLPLQKGAARFRRSV